jgi:serpin B
MRTLSRLVLCLVCACTGARDGSPHREDDEPSDVVDEPSDVVDEPADVVVPPSGVDVAQSELTREAHPKLAAAKVETFATDNCGFALALYGELAKKPGNLFFSPYSISTALAMTYAGAKGNTESEMASALHFTLPQSDLHAAFNVTNLALAKRKGQLIPSNGDVTTQGNGFELRTVDQAWGQKGYDFLDSYLDVIAKNYGAGMYLIDFGQSEVARTTINDWVADQTEQRIEDLLPKQSIDSDARLVLTNAIYFKASWLREFDVAETKPATFRAEAAERSVDMMHAKHKLNYASVGGYQAVALPYLSPEVQMLVVLPPKGAFADASAGFDAATFESLRSKLAETIVTLSLPKWSFESANALKAPMQALGMKDAFESGVADLSGMDGNPGALYIAEVYHKAFIAVNEEGTEAAAATAVVGSADFMPLEVTVTFDRPFMFLVYDQPTGQILFLGHLMDPAG